MQYNPTQTNQMPFKSKVRNMAWKVVNKSLFRFTPPHFYYLSKISCIISTVIWGESRLECFATSNCYHRLSVEFDNEKQIVAGRT